MTSGRTSEGTVPDLSPSASQGVSRAPACPECPIADVIERKEREARQAAWAGILIGVLGVLSWNTWGFLIGAVGALAAGLYACNFARRESISDFVAGLMVLTVLVLRLLDIL